MVIEQTIFPLIYESRSSFTESFVWFQSVEKGQYLNSISDRFLTNNRYGDI